MGVPGSSTSGGGSGLAQPLDERVADAALVAHDDDAGAAQHDSGRQALVGRRSQRGRGDAPGERVDRVEVTEHGVGCRGASGGSTLGAPGLVGGSDRSAGCVTELAADPAGDVVQGGELAQLEGVVALEVPAGAHGGEDLGLLDGVDAEVGLEVEVGVEQVGGVAGHLGDDAGDGVEDDVAGGGRLAGAPVGAGDAAR